MDHHGECEGDFGLVSEGRGRGWQHCFAFPFFWKGILFRDTAISVIICLHQGRFFSVVLRLCSTIEAFEARALCMRIAGVVIGSLLRTRNFLSTGLLMALECLLCLRLCGWRSYLNGFSNASRRRLKLNTRFQGAFFDRRPAAFAWLRHKLLDYPGE